MMLLRALGPLAMVAALAQAAAGCSPPQRSPSALEPYCSRTIAAEPAADKPIDAGRDASPPDAGSVTTCCRLDNARGERLDYKCGVAIDASYLEARGYRCWAIAPR